MLDLDGQVHHDTHAVPMGNYVIEVGNYVIATPSELGNYKIADSEPRLPAGEARSDPRHQVIEQARVPVMVYRGSSGCRVIDLFCKLA